MRASALSSEAAEGSPPAIRLVDVADQAGIRFKHTSGRSGRLYLPETASGGGGFIDYDGDGRLDIFLVNSAPLPGISTSAASARIVSIGIRATAPSRT
jgi:hypothetical protein